MTVFDDPATLTIGLIILVAFVGGLALGGVIGFVSGVRYYHDAVQAIKKKLEKE